MQLISSKFIVLAISVLPVFIGCESSQSEYEVIYELPPKYSGFFTVKYDKNGDMGMINGSEILFVVPENGIVISELAKHLEDWHTLKARDANGLIIPSHPYSNVPANAHALRSCGSRNKLEHVYYVGDESGVIWYRNEGVNIESQNLNENFQAYVLNQGD